MTTTNRRRPWRTVLMLLLMLTMLPLCYNFGTRLTHAAEPSDETASGKSHAPPGKSEEMSKMFKGRIVEMINAGRQVYIRIDSGKDLVWVAVPQFEGRIGDWVLVPPGVQVADYHSRKLNRNFGNVYFVGTIRRLNESELEKSR